MGKYIDLQTDVNDLTSRIHQLVHSGNQEELALYYELASGKLNEIFITCRTELQRRKWCDDERRRKSAGLRNWLLKILRLELNEKDVVAGYVKYYILPGKGLYDMKREIINYTDYGEVAAEIAKGTVWEAFKHFFELEMENPVGEEGKEI